MPAANHLNAELYERLDVAPRSHAHGNKYLSYSEGIYVGYRYYEIRYEDVVLGQGNAGDFDYASEVVFPFGHGLSYTTLSWSDYAVSDAGDSYEALCS